MCIVNTKEVNMSWLVSQLVNVTSVDRALHQNHSGQGSSSCTSLNLFFLALYISIIAWLIVEICVLWLLENLIISAYNYLAQGDYSSVTKFQNDHPAFFEFFFLKEAINAMEENWIMKRIKDSNEFGFWKSKIWSFFWLN